MGTATQPRHGCVCVYVHDSALAGILLPGPRTSPGSTHCPSLQPTISETLLAPNWVTPSAFPIGLGVLQGLVVGDPASQLGQSGLRPGLAPAGMPAGRAFLARPGLNPKAGGPIWGSVVPVLLALKLQARPAPVLSWWLGGPLRHELE